MEVNHIIVNCVVNKVIKIGDKSSNVFKQENTQTTQKASIYIGGNIHSEIDTNVESSIKPGDKKKG